MPSKPPKSNAIKTYKRSGTTNDEASSNLFEIDDLVAKVEQKRQSHYSKRNSKGASKRGEVYNDLFLSALDKDDIAKPLISN